MIAYLMAAAASPAASYGVVLRTANENPVNVSGNRIRGSGGRGKTVPERFSPFIYVPGAAVGR